MGGFKIYTLVNTGFFFKLQGITGYVSRLTKEIQTVDSNKVGLNIFA